MAKKKKKKGSGPSIQGGTKPKTGAASPNGSRDGASKQAPEEVRADRAKRAKEQAIRNPNSRAAKRARAERKAKRDRLILIGAVVAVVALVVGLVVAAGGDEVGVTDASAFDLPALDGDGEDDRFQLADYAGTPLVVNFFASWCTSCESELPRFRFAAEEFADDVEILFVNSNETGNWRPMAERTGILDQPLLKDINGANGNGLYRSLGGRGGMPLTAFYDASGDVIHVDFGELSTEALATRLQQFYQISV